MSNNAAAVSGGWVEFVYVLCVIGASMVLFRYGLLPLAIALFIDNAVTDIPLTPHLSAWWAGASTLTLIAFLALAAFGFYASRAGQPLFGAILTRE